LQNGAFDIVQPDVTKVGGISEFIKIATLADAYGVQVIPHGWNTAVGLATDLQLASSISSSNKVEYITGSAYVDDIGKFPWKLGSDGFLEIPSGPGLGYELDPDKVEKYTGAKGFI
jgi:L-alanine-DL-glutamate epimerase-like enolase superfamily enzyme